MIKKSFDIVVIGGGPAGIAAARKASQYDKRVLLIERENQLGGILKQCIHDGFGLHRYQEKLSGPEYAYREIEKLKKTNVEISTNSFVSKIDKLDNGLFILHMVNLDGVSLISASKIIFATGCRERTSKQIQITGTNPAGVMSAGQAQYYMNILGKMPGRKFIILGSGDIGLIMARRITLEGGKVLGVYEAKSTPSGLSRNISQCLNDFDIPLHLSKTVTKVFGQNRLEAVEICSVDDHMKPIRGTEEIIKCDSLILSVGLVPENELLESLGAVISKTSKGPIVDQTLLTSVDNVYSCGNSMHVNDLVDYVSDSGELAGYNAAVSNSNKRNNIDVSIDKNFLYVIPNVINTFSANEKVTFYFRSSQNFTNKKLVISNGQEVIFEKSYSSLKPPEMEKLSLDLPVNLQNLCFRLEDK